MRRRIDTYFGTTRLQSMLLVAVFDINSTGQNPDLNDVAKYFKCNTMELFIYKKELKILEEKGVFNSNTMFGFLGRAQDTFTISQEAKDAIIENRLYVPPAPKMLDAIEICERIKKVIDRRVNEESSNLELYENFQEMLSNYEELPFIGYIKKIRLSDENCMAYMYIIGA